jgi:hypothetical protein
MNASKYVAAFDSASSLLRATSRYLHGKDFPSLGSPSPTQLFMVPLNATPRKVRELAYIWGGASEALPAKQIHKIHSEDISRWVVGQYPQNQRYPAVMIGSSNGALMHLNVALGIPWLPQTVLIPIRQHHTTPDEPRRDMEEAIATGNTLLEANPDLQLHHMHDENQDYLMLHQMTYFRVKRRRLGETYEHFLLNSLAPGGTIFLDECQRTWPVTRLGDHHFFQHGATGGETEDEYIHGGKRVEDFLKHYSSRHQQLDNPQPDEEQPEAEWGFAPELRKDVERFAQQHGYRVRRIVFQEPEDTSPLVADLYRCWYQQRQLPSNRLLVESFILVDPWWTLRTGSAPFWLPFNTRSFADALEHYLGQSDPYNYIAMTLFSHGTDSIGLVPIERWQAILHRARKRGQFVGVNEKLYPRDFATFIRYHSDMKNIGSRYPLPQPLLLKQLDTFLDQYKSRYAVQWLEENVATHVR